MKLYTTYLETVIGPLEIAGTEAGITAVRYVAEAGTESADLPACLVNCRQQLAEYFSGQRREFSLPLGPEGTAFQRLVWETLGRIPFGQTISYRQLAEAVGNPQAVRAVGRANATNQLNILIPCHRVIGSDGSLTGYGGGLQRKEWLINHEHQVRGC